MVIHSASILLLLAYVVALAALIGVLVSFGLFIARRFRLAANVMVVSVAAVPVYAGAASAISALAPQRIVDAGNSYCWDSWCMGIERVAAAPRGPETEYKIDVRIFSEIGQGHEASAKDASIFLVDDRGRRFPLLNDASVIPFDTPLGAGESIRTTFLFVVAADARHLFLTGEPRKPLPDRIPMSWRLFKVFADLHFGYESLSHKPTLLRVL